MSTLVKRLTLGRVRRFFTPPEEQALVDGARAYLTGDEELALEHLGKAVKLPDAAYLAGLLALNNAQFDNAATWLTSALERHKQLGRYLARYRVNVTVLIPIGRLVTVPVTPNQRGVLLSLAVLCRQREQWDEAISRAEKLLDLDPADMSARLCLADILLEARPSTEHNFRRVVSLIPDLDEVTALHGALLLCRARALHKLGLLEAAHDTLNAMIRRKVNRPTELQRALRYERACLYDKMGQHRLARVEWEKLYAEDPDYADVADRLQATNHPASTSRHANDGKAEPQPTPSSQDSPSDISDLDTSGHRHRDEVTHGTTIRNNDPPFDLPSHGGQVDGSTTASSVRRTDDDHDGYRIEVMSRDVTPDFLRYVYSTRKAGWDIETTGLKWYADRICTVQLACGNRVAVVQLLEGHTPQKLSQILGDQNILKIFHNARFDLRFMVYHWSVIPQNVACTLELVRLLNPREQAGHTLREVLERYLAVQIIKDQTCSDWTAAQLTQEQIRYATNDVRYLPVLFDLLMNMARERRLEEAAMRRFRQMLKDVFTFRYP